MYMGETMNPSKRKVDGPGYVGIGMPFLPLPRRTIDAGRAPPTAYEIQETRSHLKGSLRRVRTVTLAGDDASVAHKRLKQHARRAYFSRMWFGPKCLVLRRYRRCLRSLYNLFTLSKNLLPLFFSQHMSL